MSELAQAMQIAAALPELQRQEIAKLTEVLGQLPIADVMTIREAIEYRREKRGTVTLLEAIMAVKGVKVRVAEWHVETHDDGRETCEHKRYAVGNVKQARHGEIGDETWLEAWIA